MSSVLNRKKKQIPAYEYTKKELAELQDLARREKYTEQMLVESHKNISLIAYQVLHDKFGFGQKRIIKAEQMINGYLEAYAEEEISTEQLQVFMKEKCGIDVKQCHLDNALS